MSIKLVFFIISLAILICNIIVICLAPAINGLIDRNSWTNENCKDYANLYKGSIGWSGKYLVNEYKSQKDRCYQRKAMIALEYTSYNFNIIFGSFYSLIGLLLFKEKIKNEEYIRYFGLIVLISEIIGFTFIFSYLIESMLVFFSPAGNTVTTHQLRINSDGFFVETIDGKYRCIFFERDNPDSLYLRYSDYGNKYLGYHQTSIYGNKYDKCSCRLLFSFEPTDYYNECNNNLNFRSIKNDCKYIYNDQPNYLPKSSYKKLYNHWLTTIIFNFIIVFLNIVLVFLGFLLLRMPDNEHKKLNRDTNNSERTNINYLGNR